MMICLIACLVTVLIAVANLMILSNKSIKFSLKCNKKAKRRIVISKTW